LVAAGATPTPALPPELSRLAGRGSEAHVVLCFWNNIQLVSYARKYEEFERRGTRIVGVSVDPPSHNGPMVEKLSLPFQLLSDPRGDLAKRCGLWNDEEGVAVPAIVVLDRGGVVRYLYAGNDFADRPGDDEVFGALDGSTDSGESNADGAVEIQVSAEEAEASTVRPERPPITLDQLVPYYRGAFFTTVALKRRFGELKDRAAFKEVDGYQKMVKEYSGFINETREAKQGS
jgi:peroxiredoxin